MHVHLPKPLHGWREFLGEVGIIVIGVLIALGAERVMHEIESRRTASAAQSRIRDEMGNSMLLLVERIAVHPCLSNRLNAIGHGLASGTTDWSGFILAPRPGFTGSAFREVYRTPSRIWVQDAYHEALAQGDLNSVDPDRRAEIAEVYKQIDGAAQLNDTETELSTQLATLQFNRKLSEPERDQLLATVTRLDWINSLMVVMAGQEFSRFRDLGYQLSPKEVADGRKYWPIKLKELHDKYGSCVDAKAIGEFDPRLVSIR